MLLLFCGEAREGAKLQQVSRKHQSCWEVKSEGPEKRKGQKLEGEGLVILLMLVIADGPRLSLIPPPPQRSQIFPALALGTPTHPV